MRYNKRFCRDPRYSGLRSFIKTGDLYNKEFAYGVVPTILDPFDTKVFKENPLRFTVVCTDIHTGKPVYHEIKNGDALDIEWIRASSSIPTKPIACAMIEKDPNHLQEIYDIGRRDALNSLEELKKYL